VAYLLWLDWCLATKNQPDTPLSFKYPNTRFSYNSRRPAALLLRCSVHDL